MNISTFQSLTASQQINMFIKGIEVGRQVHKGVIFACRQIDDFYVEYIVHTFPQFRINMQCHRNTRLLDKYFEKEDRLLIEDLIF